MLARIFFGPEKVDGYDVLNLVIFGSGFALIMGFAGNNLLMKLAAG